MSIAMKVEKPETQTHGSQDQPTSPAQPGDVKKFERALQQSGSDSGSSTVTAPGTTLVDGTEPQPPAHRTTTFKTTGDGTEPESGDDMEFQKKLETTPPAELNTLLVAADTLSEQDPSTLTSFEYAGTGVRTMFDRRSDAFIEYNAFLFDANYSDGYQIEVQVNPEFETQELAMIEAERFARSIGRIPSVLKQRVYTVSIHKDNAAFGGGNDNILIHTGRAEEYIADGILEEAFLHEGAHSSLDPLYKEDPDWIAAQQADGAFISEYAQEFPQREDIAESYPLYYAVKYHADRLPESLVETIRNTMPNRIAFFEGKGL